MSEQEQDKKDKNIQSSEEGTLANTDFMREKIKSRPVNRRKLLRRTIITVTLAIIFGLVACITFLLLEPVISKKITPQAEPQTVSFPEETEDDELQPEQMYADEVQKEALQEEEAASIVVSGMQNEIQHALSSYSLDYTNYGEMVSSLKSVAKEASKALVTVTGVTGGTDWISDSFETSGSAAGLIVADNGTDLLILVDTDAIQDADSIRVTFCDNAYCDGTLKLSDAVTGLSIVTVSNEAVTEETLDAIAIAKLGSSESTSLAGNAVIALGAPTGSMNSICYGYVTSANQTLDLTDTNQRLLSTDIYGSPSGSGILINLSGQVLGIINMDYNAEGYQNALSAYGISRLKPLIEKLSNGTPYGALGIHGTDIPASATSAEEIPSGAYITQVEMQSPAMTAGIQSGDIITVFDSTVINSYGDLVSALQDSQPEDEVVLTVMRQSADTYSSMSVTVTLGDATSSK